MRFQCPVCQGWVEADERSSQREVQCSGCGRYVPRPAAVTPPPISAAAVPTMHRSVRVLRPKRPQTPADPADKLVRAGWICLAVGALGMCVMFLIPIYGALFVASFVLGILAAARNRVGHGVALVICSLVIPPALALLIVVGFLGALASGTAGVLNNATKNLQPHQPPSAIQVAGPAPVTPTVALPSAPASAQQPVQPVPARKLHDVPLDRLLGELAAAAQPFKDATTTLQKDEVRAKVRARAAELLTNAKMTIHAEITNVRRDTGGELVLSYGSLDTRGFQPAGGPLVIHLSGETPIDVTADEALKLKAGQRIVLSGEGTFTPDDGVVGLLLSGALAIDRVVYIQIRGDFKNIGTVRLANLRWKLQ